MRVLGIETSCDETAAAVVTEGGDVLSDVVRSQVALHAPYGGVVPEVAARDHARAVVPVVREALSRAGVSAADLDGIAVTSRPGLAGALLVGLQAAKGLAWAAGKPLVGVDHLVGHLLAVFLRRGGAPLSDERERPSFPYVALLASGGHTAIYRVDGPALGAIRELGATRDDAAGEAFDKVAKLLGLGYPGGPVVDRLAAGGDAAAAADAVPALMARKESLEFSFSGIKSSVARHVAKRGRPEGQALRDLCAAFQGAVVDALVQKTVRAARAEGIGRVVLGGGVAANQGLRAKMAAACERRGLALFVPPLASCTDNGAMIAYAGALRLAAGERDTLDLAPETRTALPRVTRKGGGAR
ncbi:MULTISPECIES: tRNA (adenosine(37)-N6)-threonylcarbamoyltransferase complex transferase subunit TsaD [Sorangium]|uniref:tRNA N6-adenosine threonylcarbamoyltransferase n=1 Tax=Sorangium cellulosum (strain So ce56) TaxID=448385 RepID=TSAD_SORC5|nr:tRNA (adenosine(37)-N6)-threonylcarbamoyltransferase complex transferase subunit TsaD [Sorangium cellulosum]A9FDL0.1 RecName: Full=tRNA N6-adenosine threonylcarbamoyltransferase; AltName: Full=N6-L-threonylcarbamoyladenine synthase; Short=t(6)A synthase; AltName: Full=t(6)A37 threonylcarbamoyladenosine biosynthesis protein TsaD; AltName: Full=tRNA threonylcarbamoyladenosine biosynthesis protein TsaD [Sorangium cellulosum So ce56]CAN91772.1 putative glycoprotease [Sorangium cellulosum So ce56]